MKSKQPAGDASRVGRSGPRRFRWPGWLFVRGATLAFLLTPLLPAERVSAANLIRKQDFNFGHQLGYLYSRIEDAELPAPGEWRFETGFQAYHTRRMPLVRNPDWQRRTLFQVPGGLEVGLAPIVALQLNSDFVAEQPWRDRHSWGGNSPRVRTRIRLLRDAEHRPALALTLGVKFSSAKPYNIWEERLNYDDSNGLAGIGTGVADYFIILSASKRVGARHRLLGRVGLAPVGDPATALDRGGSQADQIPYGLAWIWTPRPDWRLRTEWAGMWGALRTTRLDHYSVLRLRGGWIGERAWLEGNLERGLTRESDDWVAGLWLTVVWQGWGAASRSVEQEPASSGEAAAPGAGRIGDAAQDSGASSRSSESR